MRLLLIAAVLPLFAQAPPCRVLVLTGASDLPHHNWRETTPQLVESIRRHTTCEVRVHEEPATLMPETLRGHDVLLLNYNGPRFPSSVERAIEDFVRAGGGFVAFHLGLYGTFYGMELDANRQWQPGSGAGWPAYRELTGASWKPSNIGHSRRHAFEVVPTNAYFGTRFGADDELYHRFDLLPSSQVAARAYSDPAQGGTGRDEPMIWTNTFGQGRTLFTTLGHDVKALAQPGVARLFARAIEWTARRRERVQ